MTEIELLIELVGDIALDLEPEIIPLTVEELAWHPGPRANSIGVTIWHIARGLDFLATRVFMQKPAEEELWHSGGWREKTGYDPRGIGYDGWGVLTGYTWDEVMAIPRLTSIELMQYLKDTSISLTTQLHSFNSETIRQPAQALLGGKLTYYRWVKEFYKGFQAHIGEIMAIKALMNTAKQPSEHS